MVLALSVKEEERGVAAERGGFGFRVQTSQFFLMNSVCFTFHTPPPPGPQYNRNHFFFSKNHFLREKNQLKTRSEESREFH